MTAAAAKDLVENAARKSAPWIVRFGRLGYVAKGIVYVVIGFLATQAAIGTGGRTTDTRGALRTIGEAPLGKIALLIVMIGLFGYAAWRLVSAVADAERRGDEPTSIALRIGEAIRALAYGSLGVWTLRYLSGNRDTGSPTTNYIDRGLDMPAGRWLVVAAGLSVVGYALWQLYKAASGKFLKRLDLSSCGNQTKVWVTRLGRFGIAARGIVFGMLGALLARAGWTYNPSGVGIDQSLDALGAAPLGGIVFGTVAAGLIAFGIFELATAKFRVMRAF
jgi:hypothetical protein